MKEVPIDKKSIIDSKEEKYRAAMTLSGFTDLILVNCVYDSPTRDTVPGKPGDRAPSMNVSSCALLAGEPQVWFADVLVFISSLVVTASLSSLLSLLAGMVLNTQRRHDALGMAVTSSVCPHPALSPLGSRSCWENNAAHPIRVAGASGRLGKRLRLSPLVSQQSHSLCLLLTFAVHTGYFLSCLRKNSPLVLHTRILAGFFLRVL